LSPRGLSLDGFPIICVAALFEQPGREVVVGFLSSNLMWIDTQKKLLHLAIGNVATSPRLKEIGIRGVGTRLVKSAIEIASSTAKSCAAELACSVAEAERDSLGFWRKFGYRWPSGLNYLQPPLEFKEDGTPVHEEVPETFMVLPLGNQNRETIKSDLLQKMIRAIYRNWCIEPNRRKLSNDALKAAEAYVMDRVYPRVAQSIANRDELNLINPLS